MKQRAFVLCALVLFHLWRPLDAEVSQLEVLRSPEVLEFAIFVVSMQLLKSQLQLIDPDELASPELLLVRTLDGAMHAVDKQTGHKQWAFQDGARTPHSRDSEYTP